MTTASEQAAAFLGHGSGTKDETPGVERPATGGFARLRELLVDRDTLDDDEADELADLAGKWRAGELEGRPKRTVRKRESVAGDGDRDGKGRERTTPETASDKAAAILRKRGF